MGSKQINELIGELEIYVSEIEDKISEVDAETDKELHDALQAQLERAKAWILKAKQGIEGETGPLADQLQTMMNRLDEMQGVLTDLQNSPRKSASENPTPEPEPSPQPLPVPDPEPSPEPEPSPAKRKIHVI